jgi:hypothetical protein
MKKRRIGRRKVFSTRVGSPSEIGFVIVRGFLSIYLKKGTNEDKRKLLLF